MTMSNNITKNSLIFIIGSFLIACNSYVEITTLNNYVQVSESSLKIIGEPSIGKSLTVNHNQTSQLSSSKVKIQWFRSLTSNPDDGVEIPGEIGLSYHLDSDDFGKFIFYEVKYEEKLKVFKSVRSPISKVISDEFKEVAQNFESYTQYISQYKFSPDETKVYYNFENSGSIGTPYTLIEYDLITEKSRILNKILHNDHFSPIASSEGFQLSPDGSKISWSQIYDQVQLRSKIFSMDLITNTTIEIAEINHQSGALTQFSNDSEELFFLNDPNIAGTLEIFKNDLQGSTSTKVSPAITPGGTVVDFKVDPSGTKLVYLASQDTAGLIELYSVSSLGGVATKLNPVITTGGKVTTFQISPDGSTVVFQGDIDTDNKQELYATSINGGPITKLNGPMVAGGSVWYDFKISSDSTKVVFRSDKDVDGEIEIFSVPIVGGTNIQLNSPLPATGDIYDFKISPDSSTVIYFGYQNMLYDHELYSVSILGGVPTRLNPALTPGSDVDEFSFHESTVYFSSDYNSLNNSKIYSVSMFGGPVTLVTSHGPADNLVFHDIVVATSGTKLLSIPNFESDELILTNMSTNEVKKISTLLVLPQPFIQSQLFSLVSTSLNMFTSVDPVTKINSLVVKDTSPENTVSLNLALPLNVQIKRSIISNDLSRVVYLANKDSADVEELYSVDINTGSVTKLNSPLVLYGDIKEYKISSDSSRVIYLADQETSGVDELYSVSILGGVVTKLNTPFGTQNDVQSSFEILPDSSRVIYIADPTDGLFEIFSVNILGGAPIKLNASLAASGDVNSFKISQDSSRVIYKADQDTDNINELYSTLPTGGVPIKINSVFQPDGDIRNFWISPNSSKVVYTADQDVDQNYELYSVNISGGSLSKLNSTFVLNGDIKYYSVIISEDSSTVLYLADQEVDGMNELYSVNINGGPSIKLNGDLVPNGTVDNFQLSLDQTTVFYYANQDNINVNNIYKANLDGTNNRNMSRLTTSSELLTNFVTLNSSSICYIYYDRVLNKKIIHHSRDDIGIKITPINITNNYLRPDKLFFNDFQNRVYVDASNSDTHSLVTLMIEMP
jgi:dipeptidyl aminopeptidase/acylaminoacyl peptidase